MTPTQRSVKHLRDAGWPLVEVVEHHGRHTARTHDLWGWCDILAVGPQGILAVQTTSDNGGNVAARVRKVTESDTVAPVREAGIAIHVHGWKPDGRLRVVDVS